MCDEFDNSTTKGWTVTFQVETKSINEELIARYLLGDLSEEEQIRLEDLAFSDQDVLQEILAVESDLIDEYARGELSDSQRRQFEGRFLTSAERRQKVEFARAFAKVVPESATERAFRPAAAGMSTSWWESLKSLLSNLTPPVKFAMAAALSSCRIPRPKSPEISGTRFSFSSSP